MMNAGNRTSRTFVLGASTVPGEFIVPRMRAMIGKYVPGVGLRVEIGDSQQIYGKVASGDIELGIIGTIFSSAEVDFTVASKDDRLVVIVPVSHPLAARSSVSLADLKGERFIAREQGSGTRDSYEKALGDAGLAPSDLRIAAEVGDSASVVKAVASGAGIGIVSELAAQDAIEKGLVRPLNIPVLTIARNFYIIRQKGKELSEDGDRILSVMLAVLR